MQHGVQSLTESTANKMKDRDEYDKQIKETEDAFQSISQSRGVLDQVLRRSP